MSVIEGKTYENGELVSKWQVVHFRFSGNPSIKQIMDARTLESQIPDSATMKIDPLPGGYSSVEFRWTLNE